LRRYPKGIQNHPKLSQSPARYLITHAPGLDFPLDDDWKRSTTGLNQGMGSGEFLHVASLGLWRFEQQKCWFMVEKMWVYG
jgi:hypothetical protein